MHANLLLSSGLNQYYGQVDVPFHRKSDTCIHGHLVCRLKASALTSRLKVDLVRAIVAVAQLQHPLELP